MVNKEFLPTGQSVNKDNYSAVLLVCVHIFVVKVQDCTITTAIYCTRYCTGPHFDNCSRFLTKNQIKFIPVALYSPDMAFRDFLLLQLKLPLSVTRFKTIKSLKEKLVTKLEAKRYIVVHSRTRKT